MRLCLCVRLEACVCATPCGSQKWALDTLKLELQAIVKCLTWILELKLRSFRRTARTFTTEPSLQKCMHACMFVYMNACMYVYVCNILLSTSYFFLDFSVYLISVESKQFFSRVQFSNGFLSEVGFRVLCLLSLIPSFLYFFCAIL